MVVKMLFHRTVRRFSVFWYGFGLVGNSLAVIYFLSVNKKNFKKMTSYHFLIIAMAILDSLVCFSRIVLGFIEWNTGYYTRMGRHMEIYTSGIFSLVSIWVLVLISFVRCHSIVKPFAIQWKKRYYFRIILVMSCLTVVFLYSLTKLPEDKHLYLYHNSCALMLYGIIPQVLMFYYYQKTRKHIKQDNTGNQNRISSRKRQCALKTLKGLLFLNFTTILILKIFLYLMSIARRLGTISNTDKEIMNHFFTFSNYTLSYSTNILNIVVYAKMMPKFRRFIFRKDFTEKYKTNLPKDNQSHKTETTAL